MRSRHTLWSLGLLFISCADAPREATPPPPTPRPSVAVSSHEHSAPHGGALIELGEEFAHLELVFDKASGGVTLYSLDGEAEKAIRLKQKEIALVLTAPAQSAPVVLQAVSNPLTGEVPGDASEFKATVPGLQGLDAFEGTISEVSSRGAVFRDVALRYPDLRH